MSKGPEAFRTISEVAEELDLPQHVLRFWETRFTQIKPMKRGGGRRYYRPDDVDLLRGIRRLLYGEGYTIKGVQRILKEQGARHVIGAGLGMGLDPAPEGDEPDDYSGDLVDEPDFDAGPEEGDFDDQQPDEGDRGGRREPVFGARSEPVSERHAAAPSVRSQSERGQEAYHGGQEAYHGGRVDPPTGPSRIPVAPPDLPSSAEDYLPPLIADLPLPPERSGGHPRQESVYAPPQASQRREPTTTPSRPHSASAGYGEPEPERHAGPSYAAQPVASRSHADRERLQATLMELLECKRILDNVR